jgi:hypothetical protein
MSPVESAQRRLPLWMHTSVSSFTEQIFRRCRVCRLEALLCVSQKAGRRALLPTPRLRYFGRDAEAAHTRNKLYFLTAFCFFLEAAASFLSRLQKCDNLHSVKRIDRLPANLSLFLPV